MPTHHPCTTWSIHPAALNPRLACNKSPCVALLQGSQLPVHGVHTSGTLAQHSCMACVSRPGVHAHPALSCRSQATACVHPVISQGLRILASGLHAPRALTRCSHMACISRPMMHVHTAPSHAPDDLAGPTVSSPWCTLSHHPHMAHACRISPRRLLWKQIAVAQLG